MFYWIKYKQKVQILDIPPLISLKDKLLAHVFIDGWRSHLLARRRTQLDFVTFPSGFFAQFYFLRFFCSSFFSKWLEDVSSKMTFHEEKYFDQA